MLDGEASDLPPAVPGLDADGRHPGAGAQGGVVAAAQEVVGFGEQGAGHTEADSGDGEEDGEVVGAVVGGVGLGERFQQFADLVLRLGEELVGGVCLGEEGGEGSARGLGGSGGDGECGGYQDLPQAGGGESPDPVLFQELGEGGDAQLEGLCGSPGLVPELDEPGMGQLVEEGGDGEQLGVVAPELLSDLVAEAGALAGQLVEGPGAFPQLEDQGLLQVEAAEEVGVGAQGAREHPGIAAVVLGPGGGIAAPGAADLGGTDGVDREAGDEQPLDDRPVGRLDGDPDLPGRGPGLLQEPAGELRLPRAAVGKGLAAANRTVRVQEAYMVCRRAPVDADEPRKGRGHGAVVLPRAIPRVVVSRRDVREGLNWLLNGAALLPCVYHGQESVEAQSGVGVRNTYLWLVAPGGSANGLVR